MPRAKRIFHNNDHGVTIVSVLLALVVMLIAVGGIGVAAIQLSKATRKAEAANLAVAVEANLLEQFNNKLNFPEPTGAVASPNQSLRDGTITSLTLHPAFASAGLVVPVQTSGTTPGVSGFLSRTFLPCPGFSKDCVLHYEVRLKKTDAVPALPPGQKIYVYSFAYQVDVNPDVVAVAPLGNINTFDTVIDPGTYRVEKTLASCDPVNDLFMTGLNRDTGEAFCAEKPLAIKCPDGHLPKGLHFAQYQNQRKSGTVELDCTAASMRTFHCPTNYSLQSFNPQYADPENTSFQNSVPGTCVFRFSHSAPTPSTVAIPANPTSPYVKTVAGTFCPPFYQTTGHGCNLVPDTSRNTSQAYGAGKCASTAYKNCTRTTYTDVVTSGSVTTAPTRTCSFVETSPNCDGVPTVASTCATKLSWSSGTAYATGVYTTYPTAVPVSGASGRDLNCTFQDTSPPCTAPSTDANGNTWGKKNAKWYGGVQVKNETCAYSSALGGPETVSAQP